jgi:aspartate racemase
MFIHQVIVEELSRGVINQDSQARYLRIIDQLRGEGAQGIILGCTEIPLLVSQEDTAVTVFDTTGIHVQAIVDSALG